MVQDKIEWKTGAFVQISKTAVSDVLTDEGGKTPVKYIQNSDTGVYMPQK